MILNFPQWQGIGFPTNVQEGARRIAAMLDASRPIKTVPVTPAHPLINDDGIFGRADIFAQFTAALSTLDAEKPNRILTIGGDCGIEVAPSAYLNNLYDGDIQIFWFDAHADINTTEMSFSAHFHGMPLGMLLGEEDNEFTRTIPKKITPDQIVFCGLRSIDPPEEEYMARHEVKSMTFESLPTLPKKYKRAILHVDSDVLDASIYNECSTPTTGGTDVPTLLAGIAYVFQNYDVVGATLTEYAPGKADAALPLIRDIFLNGLKGNDPMWV